MALTQYPWLEEAAARLDAMRESLPNAILIHGMPAWARSSSPAGSPSAFCAKARRPTARHAAKCPGLPHDARQRPSRLPHRRERIPRKRARPAVHPARNLLVLEEAFARNPHSSVPRPHGLPHDGAEPRRTPLRARLSRRHGARRGRRLATQVDGGAARGVRLHSCGRRHRRCAPDDPLEVAPAARGRSVEGGRACMALVPESASRAIPRSRSPWRAARRSTP